MNLERVSDKEKTQVQNTKRKDFTRIHRERLELDPTRDFLRGGVSPDAKPLPIGWVERHERDTVEQLDTKIKRYQQDVKHCNEHKNKVDTEWYTNLVKKLKWYKNRKKELSEGAGTS